jgi:hypothetical protein
MFNDKILKSVAEAVKAVVDEALKGDQHKIDKNKNGKVDAHDFKLLRKEEAKKPASPFDWKNTPRQTAEKGEKTGHTAKKISTGTVYTKKYTKEEASQEEFNKEIKIAQDKSMGKSKAQVAKPAVQAVQNEQVEQLDELSKKTLGSYVKKAAFDLGQKGISAGQYAAKKKWSPITKNMNKRTDSIVKATDRLTKEEVEQLDELKKSTLASYVKKASHDVAHKGALTRQFANDSAAAKKDSNYWDAKKADDKSNKMFAKSWKRRENMGKAVDRLAKEEVVVEGSGPKEKQKTPYRDINSPEYRAAVEKQKQRMAKDKAAEPGKKMLKKEEVEQVTEAKFDAMKHIDKKNQTPTIKTAAKDVKRSSYADRAALMKAGGVKDDRGPRGVTQEEVEHIEERSLSTGEKAAMEKNVKGMKKNIAGFKERYGKDAKSVMYATATKQAKGE